MIKKISIAMLLALCLWGVSGGVALAADPATGGLVNCGKLENVKGKWMVDKDGKQVLDANNKPIPLPAALDCDFAAAIAMINLLIKYMIYIAMPLAAIAFAYAGWLYLTAGGESGIEKSKKIFTNVGIGFALILCSWLAFKLIATTFLKDKPDPSGKPYGTYLN